MKSCLLGVALLFVLSAGPAVNAAVFNCAGGDVACLINAVNTANANGEDDTIILAEGGTYILTAPDPMGGPDGPTGLPSITSPITVDGNAAVIERDSTAPDFRIFHVAEAGDLMLNELTVRNGLAAGDADGGGIFTRGTLMLTNSTVSGCSADHEGGGINNRYGTVELTNSTVSGNTVSGNGTGAGGGIYIIGDTERGVLRLINSTVSDNNSGRNGGGINHNGGRIELTNSTVSGNSAGHLGGGMLLDDEPGGTLINVTITNNSAPIGGGVFVETDLIVMNTMVAGNLLGGDCARGFPSNGYNLDSDGSCGLSGIGDLSGVDPLLGPLADNGGHTHTHALLPGSPAIDVVPDTNCTLPTDQRDVARPQGPACDIGAFEVEVEAVTQVLIDIKPGNKRNTINPRSRGKIKAAILSTNTAAGEALDFDALQVDPASVRFGPDEAEAVRYRGEDVDHDGDADLLLFFRTRKTGIACGDTEATLTGETYAGQQITGTDAIKTVGCD